MSQASQATASFEPVVVDQSSWGAIAVTGADRARFLQGMLSNDVAGLADGGWCRAVALNVKGRVLAVADVVRQDAEQGGRFLLLTEPVTAGKLLALLQKHAIADDVELEAVPGLAVHRVWETPESVWTAPPLFAARAGSPAEAVEVRRVEAGLPRYDADVCEDYFPFEANLDRLLSATKGCYIGQEVVARANARGQAKKRLVGLVLGGEGGAVAAESVVAAAERPEAGKVTSSVVSPVFGPIALAYVHHTVWEPGTTLTVAGRAAVVSALPFSRG